MIAPLIRNVSRGLARVPPRASETRSSTAVSSHGGTWRECAAINGGAPPASCTRCVTSECGARSTRGLSSQHLARRPSAPSRAPSLACVTIASCVRSTRGLRCPILGGRHASAHNGAILPLSNRCVQLVDGDVRSAQDGAAPYALGHQRAARQLPARRLVPVESAHPLQPSPSRSLRAPTPPRSALATFST